MADGYWMDSKVRYTTRQGQEVAGEGHLYEVYTIGLCHVWSMWSLQKQSVGRHICRVLMTLLLCHNVVVTSCKRALQYADGHILRLFIIVIGKQGGVDTFSMEFLQGANS